MRLRAYPPLRASCLITPRDGRRPCQTKAIVLAPLPRLTPCGPFPKLAPQSQERVYIMQVPTLRDVYEAKKTIAPYLTPATLQHSPGLSRMRRAIGVLIEEAHTVAEGAGAPS